MTKTNISGARFEVSARWHDGVLYVSSLNLSWEEPGARFHVWLQTRGTALGWPQDCPDMGAGFDCCIYKNPPLGVAHGSAEDFRTRQLDGTKPVNKARYLEAFAAAGGLPGLKRAQFNKGKELRAADELARKEREERARLERIKEHGPELLACLEQWAEYGRNNGGTENYSFLQRTLDAIATARGPAAIAPEGWRVAETSTEDGPAADTIAQGERATAPGYDPTCALCEAGEEPGHEH